MADDTKWTHHPQADISVLKLTPRDKRKNLQEFRGISANNVEKERKSISREVRLAIYGFPRSLGALDFKTPATGKAAKFLSPFSYHSFPSSELFPFGKQEFIALENLSTEGYSGGPVFDFQYAVNNPGMITFSSPSMKILGFIYGNINDSTGGKFCVITPSYYLWDLIK